MVSFQSFKPDPIGAGTNLSATICINDVLTFHELDSLWALNKRVIHYKFLVRMTHPNLNLGYDFSQIIEYDTDVLQTLGISLSLRADWRKFKSVM